MPSHPHFDDQGAVSWYQDLASAQEVARASGRRLFIESGRRACAGCRDLVEKVIPEASVRDLLREHFVCVADDCDRMAPRVQALATRLSPPRMLPFIFLTDAEAKWLAGTSGSQTVEELGRLIRTVVGVER